FISPTNTQLFLISPTNILMSVSVTNGLGTITNVSFFKGASKLGQSTASPWQALWTNAPAGTNILSAVASDDRGLFATNTITITNNALPLVSILSPTNLQTFREVTNVLVTITNFDADGSISQLKLFWHSNFSMVSLTTNNSPGSSSTFTWS